MDHVTPAGCLVVMVIVVDTSRASGAEGEETLNSLAWNNKMSEKSCLMCLQTRLLLNEKHRLGRQRTECTEIVHLTALQEKHSSWFPKNLEGWCLYWRFLWLHVWYLLQAVSSNSDSETSHVTDGLKQTGEVFRWTGFRFAGSGAAGRTNPGLNNMHEH